jgi:hypothetical protein
MDVDSIEFSKNHNKEDTFYSEFQTDNGDIVKKVVDLLYGGMKMRLGFTIDKKEIGNIIGILSNGNAQYVDRFEFYEHCDDEKRFFCEIKTKNRAILQKIIDNI